MCLFGFYVVVFKSQLNDSARLLNKGVIRTPKPRFQIPRSVTVAPIVPPTAAKTNERRIQVWMSARLMRRGPSAKHTGRRAATRTLPKQGRVYFLASSFDPRKALKQQAGDPIRDPSGSALVGGSLLGVSAALGVSCVFVSASVSLECRI